MYGCGIEPFDCDIILLFIYSYIGSCTKVWWEKAKSLISFTQNQLTNLFFWKCLGCVDVELISFICFKYISSYPLTLKTLLTNSFSPPNQSQNITAQPSLQSSTKKTNISVVFAVNCYNFSGLSQKQQAKVGEKWAYQKWKEKKFRVFVVGWMEIYHELGWVDIFVVVVSLSHLQGIFRQIPFFSLQSLHILSSE